MTYNTSKHKLRYTSMRVCLLSTTSNIDFLNCLIAQRTEYWKCLCSIIQCSYIAEYLFCASSLLIHSGLYN